MIIMEIILRVFAVPEKKIHELGILDEAHSPAMSIMDIAGLFVVL